ncbi:MAG: hypothetical protein WAM58_06660 [Candidatus Acidiferrum sp.]
MPRLKDQLKVWAATELKYWEQAALEKLSKPIEIKDEDLMELVEYFIQDAGLEPIPGERRQLALSESNVAEVQETPCRMIRIFN